MSEYWGSAFNLPAPVNREKSAGAAKDHPAQKPIPHAENREISFGLNMGRLGKIHFLVAMASFCLPSPLEGQVDPRGFIPWPHPFGLLPPSQGAPRLGCSSRQGIAAFRWHIPFNPTARVAGQPITSECCLMHCAQIRSNSKARVSDVCWLFTLLF